MSEDKKAVQKENQQAESRNSRSVLDAVFAEVAQKKEEVAQEKATVKKKSLKSVAKGKKKKVIKQVAVGNVYIQATYNNTIVSFSDQNGNVIGWSSAGKCGFKGPKKATPYAAGVIVKDATLKVAENGLKDVHVFIKGVGLGREAAVRALNSHGINVLSIKDITPIPHNGVRKKKPRRV